MKVCGCHRPVALWALVAAWKGMTDVRGFVSGVGSTHTSSSPENVNTSVPLYLTYVALDNGTEGTQGTQGTQGTHVNCSFTSVVKKKLFKPPLPEAKSLQPVRRRGSTQSSRECYSGRKVSGRREATHRHIMPSNMNDTVMRRTTSLPVAG